jgi:hypothetical protein
MICEILCRSHGGQAFKISNQTLLFDASERLNKELNKN